MVPARDPLPTVLICSSSRDEVSCASSESRSPTRTEQPLLSSGPYSFQSLRVRAVDDSPPNQAASAAANNASMPLAVFARDLSRE